ncbi:MAG: molecular chaperone HtpG [Candidatus Auribacterota bacterium]|jgi:molecular chaperone HtpG|nr:molecular chaperone HtpG [Candidatus Auribacterota bacterium]
MQKFEFQAETKQLLDLMIHSIYSNKEIFLRELISNSSDALDKLRFESLTNDKLKDLAVDLHIRIDVDSKKRTLSVIDNGIGMSRQEVIDYVGTIARSGSKEFLRLLSEKKDRVISPELIGQFGVGLYASFMVADKITIVTRKAGENTATFWESTGDGTYSLDETTRDSAGTTITLHLKPEDTEDELHDYTREWKIREIVRKYSDYVQYPIKMKIERSEIERDKDGKPKEGAKEKTVVTDETLNSIKAIWTRPEDDVSDDEYKEFYKHISHDWNDPLTRIVFKAEGLHEFRGLLFIPSKAPMDMYVREGEQGIHLYIRRIFIMNDCKELIPEYLRFLRGVVDSEDLSLNISREILQKNRQIQVIRQKVIAKVLEKLEDIKSNDKETYLKFWNEFGQILKEGIFHDAKNREKLLDLTMMYSTQSDSSLTTFREYISRMQAGQDTIYYMSGKSRQAIENSPHLEAFKDKGYEVLLFTHPVDELWVQSVFEFDKMPLKSIGKGTIDLGTEEEKKQAQEKRKETEKDFRTLLDSLRASLQDNIKEVRLSSRLTSSPVCLVGEQSDLTPQMEEMLRAMGQDIPKTKRILEVNPDHPIIVQMQKRFSENKKDPVLNDYAELLYGLALLAEGSQPPDQGKFSKTIADVMARALS